MTLAFNNTGRLVSEKPHKYRAQPQVINGIRFPSKAEADAYMKLIMLQRAGEVQSFTRQPVFRLHGGIKYIADFDITWKDGRRSIVDVKGLETPVFKLKMKLMKVDHPDVVVEIWH